MPHCSILQVQNEQNVINMVYNNVIKTNEIQILRVCFDVDENANALE